MAVELRSCCVSTSAILDVTSSKIIDTLLHSAIRSLFLGLGERILLAIPIAPSPPPVCAPSPPPVGTSLQEEDFLFADRGIPVREGVLFALGVCTLCVRIALTDLCGMGDLPRRLGDAVITVFKDCLVEVDDDELLGGV